MLLSAVLLASVSGFVNPMIGTGNGGNTCPGPVWPLGMVQPGPDTSLVTRPHDHDPAEYSQELDYRSMCNGYDPRSDVLFGGRGSGTNDTRASRRPSGSISTSIRMIPLC